MYDDSLEDLTAEFGLDTHGSRGLISSSDELHPDIYGAMPSSPTPLRTRAPYPKEHHSLLSEHTAYKPQNNNAVLGLPTRYQPNVQGYQRPLLFADPFSEMVDQDLEDGSQDIPSYKNPNRPPAPLPPVSARQNSATVTRPRGHNPRNAHSISLRPVSDLPDIYRTLFKFGVFNAVQSRCYDTVRRDVVFKEKG
ncbi:hypothetical protein FRC03_002739 [Tulasnella sp. 419]|nr:hypothetical protein FRC03_002739 [Tulasnella sp. 419]